MLGDIIIKISAGNSLVVQQLGLCSHWQGHGFSPWSSTAVFIVALFTIARAWKQPKCQSTEEWIKNTWYLHTVEYYSAIKKNNTGPLAATQVGLEIVIMNEVRHRQKNTILLICGIWKKKGYKWNYLQNRSRVKDVENKLMVTRSKGGEER